jgi:hypothetical protein
MAAKTYLRERVLKVWIIPEKRVFDCIFEEKRVCSKKLNYFAKQCFAPPADE